ncbi:MAG: hypothetical protein BWY68_00309 [bacterium ADurb.Bin400]|nr:MAG: hypothetical protein BWY68_00309 [bacterium ADurb.Bin400]
MTSGTLTGIVISGNIEPGFIANVAIDPMPVLPEGKTLSVQSDSTGSWELILDFPIKSGFYKMTVQGQNEKRLTPASDEIRFEITQVKGGAITILTDEDANEPVAAAPVTTESESLPKTSVWQQHMVSIFASAGTIVLVAALLLARRHRLKKKRLLNSLDLASQANHPPDAQ